jgi:hypothetical protein
MRPLRFKTKVLADEYVTESLFNLDQEIKVNYLFLINKFE